MTHLVTIIVVLHPISDSHHKMYRFLALDPQLSYNLLHHMGHAITNLCYVSRYFPFSSSPISPGLRQPECWWDLPFLAQSWYPRCWFSHQWFWCCAGWHSLTPSGRKPSLLLQPTCLQAPRFLEGCPVRETTGATRCERQQWMSVGKFRLDLFTRVFCSIVLLLWCRSLQVLRVIHSSITVRIKNPTSTIFLGR